MRSTLLAGTAILTAAPIAAGQALALDSSSALLGYVRQNTAQPEPVAQPATAPQPATLSTEPAFGALTTGDQRRWFFTVGAGIAPSGNDGTHADIFGAWSTFIGKNLELQLEASGWYFDQEDSTAGAGFAFNLRWHIVGWAYADNGGGNGSDITLFADAGIGLIFAGDDVPDQGSSLNLSPRIGGGFTARLSDDGHRLVAGIRWHHLSNARSNGDSENPDFNAPMLYLGVQWPLGL